MTSDLTCPSERVRSGERVMYAEMPPCAGDVRTDWRELLDSWRAGHRVHADDLQELVFRGQHGVGRNGIGREV